MRKLAWIKTRKNIFKDIKFNIRDDIFKTKYYKIIVTYFCALHLWPYSDSSQSSFKIFVFSTLYYVLTMTIIIPQILSLIYSGLDAYDIINCVTILLYHVMALTKFTELLTNKLKIKEIFDKIMKDWQAITNEAEHELLIKSYNNGYFCHKLVIALSGFGWIIINVLIYIPFVTETFFGFRKDTRIRTFKNPGYYFIDVDWSGDVIRGLHFSIVTFINCFVTVGCDIFFIMSVAHISGMFSVLSHKVLDVGSEMNYKNKSAMINDCDTFLKELKEIVIHHTEILRHLVFLESTLSYSLIVIQILCIAVLPMMLFVTYGGLKHPVFSVQTLLFNFAYIAKIFFLNIAGQSIIDQSNNVYSSIYNSDWYKLPLEYQKFLTIIMIRSLHPSKIIAGKIATLSLRTFVMIMKTVFSYFTVLLSIS